MNMRKRLIAGIIVGLSASSIGVASISASAATTIGATAASINAPATPGNRVPPPGTPERQAYDNERNRAKQNDPGWGCGQDSPGGDKSNGDYSNGDGSAGPRNNSGWGGQTKGQPAC